MSDIGFDRTVTVHKVTIDTLPDFTIPEICPACKKPITEIVTLDYELMEYTASLPTQPDEVADWPGYDSVGAGFTVEVGCANCRASLFDAPNV